MKTKKLSTVDIRNQKGGEKLVTITAYDYTFARLVDPHVDIVLVGDSLGMVIQGEPNTLSVTMDQMVYHAKAVARGLTRAHLVVDLPFLSYQTGIDDAVRNAGRLLAEGKAEAVKLEGGTRVAKTVETLVGYGIPVMGHIGLTPQSVHEFGGFKIQGKSEKGRESILNDALALDDAGVYAMVLEGIPADLAKEITSRVSVPTIGIGAGKDCDGQVLVMQDLLGLNEEFRPKFAKVYADLSGDVRRAVLKYSTEVQKGEFPGPENSF